MKAAVLRHLGGALTIEDVRMTALRRGQLRVKMQLAAVCRSQLLEIRGAKGPDRYLPHLIGHEGVGVVQEIGEGVAKAAPGDQVVLSWIRGSGLANDPVVYESNSGNINAGPVATFCEEPVVGETCVTKISPAVDPRDAVLAGCALATGAGTVLNAGVPKPGGSICIVGAGGVGLSAIAGAVASGWATRIAIDTQEARLARAREIGATHTFVATEPQMESRLIEMLEGGADLVVECAGAPQTMELAVRLAKPKGGRVILAGNLPAHQKIQIDPMLLIQGRILSGSWGGGTDADRDLPGFVARAADGRLPARKLLGNFFKLDQIQDALAALEGSDPGRPIIDFGT